MLKKIFLLYFCDTTPAGGWRKAPPIWLVWNASARRAMFIFGVIATLFATPGMSREPRFIEFEGGVYLREDVVGSNVIFAGGVHQVEGFGYNGGLDTLFGGSPKKVAMKNLLGSAGESCPLGFKLRDLRIADIHRGSYTGRYRNGAEPHGDSAGAHLKHGGFTAKVYCAEIYGQLQ